MRRGVGERVAERTGRRHATSVRAFLAIPLRPPALAALVRTREQLVAEVPGVRWAPADSPHITLHFFGSISPHDAERALGALRPVLDARPPMNLRLRGLGSFPAHRHARVLWFGIDGDVDALTACARGCADALEAAGFAVERRPFRAHCTLGRPRVPWPAQAQDAWQRQAATEPCTPAFTADRAILFESVTVAGGVRHLPREVVVLGSDAAPSLPVRHGEQ